jgi:hypothetical protein
MWFIDVDGLAIFFKWLSHFLPASQDAGNGIAQEQFVT